MGRDREVLLSVNIILTRGMGGCTFCTDITYRWAGIVVLSVSALFTGGRKVVLSG